MNNTHKMNKYIKILSLVVAILLAFSCNKKLDQKNMFQGRVTTNKKKGHYDTGVRRNKPMSVQYAEASRKENKDVTDPKKMAKEAEKELKKKKKEMSKHNRKFGKESKYKLKTTKGKPTGGGQ